MKISEFEERVEELGYWVWHNDTANELSIMKDIDAIYDTEMVLSISTVEVEAIRVHRHLFKLDKKDREQLLLLAYALADTDIGER